jgi:hypothetical protein
MEKEEKEEKFSDLVGKIGFLRRQGKRQEKM